MKNYDSIGFLFDLDGVLIDSETEYTRIWNEIDKHFPTGIENFAIKIKGQTLPEILNRNFQASLHKDVVEMLNAKEQQMRYNLLPGALKLLDGLRNLGYGCVLVTSSNDLKMRHLREEQPNLESYFKDIVTADRITRSKPDPEGYLLGASILGARPERCVVFEDSVQGVKAGKAAGAYVIGMTTTLPAASLEAFTDRLVKDLSEIEIEELANLLLNR